MSTSAIARTLACAGVLLSGGCDRLNQHSSSYAVLVRAVDEIGQPLAGLQLTAAGRKLGATDATGSKLVSWVGNEGERVQFSASCPTGYTGPRERPVVELRRIQSPQSPSIQPIPLSLTCDAKEHVSLVAIRTGRAGVPVKLRGQAVALTSSTGTAHVVLKEPTGNAIELMLDTSMLADVRPESPTRSFTIAARDGFTVWDQPLEAPAKRPASSKKRSRYRLEAPHAPPSPPSPPSPGQPPS
jgi:hypothetical protein